MTHVFLSYSRDDTAFMQRLRTDLQAAGLEVWTDEILEPGTPSWKDAIEKAIEKSSCLIVILSPDAKQSKWVKEELNYADTQAVMIYPVIIRGGDKDSVPIGLTAAQWIDARNEENYSQGLHRLIQSIQLHDAAHSGGKQPNINQEAHSIRNLDIGNIDQKKKRTTRIRLGAIVASTLILAALFIFFNNGVQLFPIDISIRPNYSKDTNLSSEKERYQVNEESPFSLEQLDRFMTLKVVSMGKLTDTNETASEVVLTITNVGSDPMRITVDESYFALVDQLGRYGRLVYFCCEANNVVMQANEERDINLIFKWYIGWIGNVDLFLNVQGFTQVTLATWRVSLPPAAF